MSYCTFPPGKRHRVLAHIYRFSRSNVYVLVHPLCPHLLYLNMFARAFALITLLSMLAVVLANPAQKRQFPDISSIVSEVTSGFNSLTSAAGSGVGGATSVIGSVASEVTSAVGSVATEATSAIGSVATEALTFVTSAGGSVYTQVSAQGTWYSIATDRAGSAYSVALSAAQSATSRALETNAATHGLRPDWFSFPLLTALVAVTGGIFVGAAVVF
ncbi:hypothetical protein RSOLAG1IB_02743 [Rhizoctonia solani AG-1 IB]|uniref:Transmembrane protein n=1 Tax=Thanatephorus cucumeris (strain AG1-IB / isolate 7/3/14) TaxID=1108050 RepID=A0A0B7FP57_THACB|nr:hypothetical protein RSOLAG1IB_02743 [Rhizoctonia solani AG-1 IB]